MSFELVSAVIAFGSLIVAYLILRSAIRLRSDSAMPTQLSAIPDFIASQYLDRRLPAPLKLGNTNLETLREAREHARRHVSPKPGKASNAARDKFLLATLSDEAWQNDFAYELSLGLEQVGAWIMAGAIPLRVVLALHSSQILEDWGYCSRLVNQRIRQDGLSPNNPAKDDDSVYFERRHAEWLACAAAVYVRRNWHGASLEQVAPELSDLKAVKRRERTLRKLEKAIIPNSVNRSIRVTLYGR